MAAKHVHNYIVIAEFIIGGRVRKQWRCACGDSYLD